VTSVSSNSRCTAQKSFQPACGTTEKQPVRVPSDALSDEATLVLPTFFVIGATKAGTTSLSNYLSSHPEIHMSPIKEPDFFVEPGDGFATLRDRIPRIDKYEALFSTSLAVRGEASTSYSHYPARGAVPERISLRIPDAKIIYLVRDPIDRLVSHYRHQVALDGERRPLEIAVADLTDPFNVFVCASRYGTQLQRYLRVFPPEHILVIDQADLRENREETLAEIFEFLAVDKCHKSPVFEEEFGSSQQRRQYPQWYGGVARTSSGAALRACRSAASAACTCRCDGEGHVAEARTAKRPSGPSSRVGEALRPRGR
jgi:hypothetical protein